MNRWKNCLIANLPKREVEELLHPDRDGNPPSGWLSPTGEFLEVGFALHDKFGAVIEALNGDCKGWAKLSYGSGEAVCSVASLRGLTKAQEYTILQQDNLKEYLKDVRMIESHTFCGFYNNLAKRLIEKR